MATDAGTIVMYDGDVGGEPVHVMYWRGHREEIRIDRESGEVTVIFDAPDGAPVKVTADEWDAIRRFHSMKRKGAGLCGKRRKGRRG